MKVKPFHEFCKVFLLCFSVSFSFAQLNEANTEVDDSKPTKHALGLMGSIDSGVGLSYRFIPDRFGFQVSTLPLYANFGSGFYYQYIGGSLQYRIRKGERLDLYSYAGTNVSIAFVEGIEIFDHAAGIGAGVDINLFKHFSLLLQVGYAFNFREEGVLLGEVRTFFSPGIGVLYNF